MLVRPAPEWPAEEFGPGSPSRCDQPAFALEALSLASDTYENMRRTQQGAFAAPEDDDGDGASRKDLWAQLLSSASACLVPGKWPVATSLAICMRER